jgi:hypothetical protein
MYLGNASQGQLRGPGQGGPGQGGPGQGGPAQGGSAQGQEWTGGLQRIADLITASGTLCVLGFPFLSYFFWGPIYGVWGVVAGSIAVVFFMVSSIRFEVHCRRNLRPQAAPGQQPAILTKLYSCLAFLGQLPAALATKCVTKLNNCLTFLRQQPAAFKTNVLTFWKAVAEAYGGVASHGSNHASGHDSNP